MLRKGKNRRVVVKREETREKWRRWRWRRVICREMGGRQKGGPEETAKNLSEGTDRDSGALGGGGG